MATVGRPPGGEKFGGRKKGVLNKATADVRKMAQTYGPEAVDILAGIMKDESKPDAARIAAAKELLDRGFGKSPQSLDLSSSDGSMGRYPPIADDVLDKLNQAHGD